MVNFHYMTIGFFIFKTSNVDALSMHFNTTGYQHCVFNVAQYNNNQDDFYDIDVAENMLVRTQGIQRWTLFGLYPLNGNASKLLTKMSLESPHYLKETCSVNIVVSVRQCYGYNVLRIFGQRRFKPQSLFFFMLGSNTRCIPSETNTDGPVPIVADIYSVYFPKVADSITSLSSCLSCSVQHPYTIIPSTVDPHNIEELQKFSAEIRRSIKPYIARISDRLKRQRYYKQCRFMYGNLPSTWPKYIGCSPELLSIQNSAEKLNVSLAYLSEQTEFVRETNYFLTNPPMHFYAVAALRIWDQFPYSISSLYYSDLVVHTEGHKFMYCVQFEERESFSFLFWTIPFDLSSWQLLSVRGLALTIQVRGNWFQISSILMRQSCTILNSNKT